MPELQQRGEWRTAVGDQEDELLDVQTLQPK
jgi:hypothetical protein